MWNWGPTPRLVWGQVVFKSGKYSDILLTRAISCDVLCWFSIVAQQCIQKSILLLNFVPVWTKGEGQKAESTEDCGLSHSEKRQRTSSVVEADFQAADAALAFGSSGPVSSDSSPAADSRTAKQVLDSPPSDTAPASQSKPLDGPASEQEDALSSPSTPTRKPPFSRGRLRLLSFRSMEEHKPAPSIKEKYPILRHVLDFIKDQSLFHER